MTTGPVPKLIEPMLAELADRPFDSPSHLFEIKWDGFRCLAFLDEETRLQSRNLKDLTCLYPELHNLHLSMKRRPAVVDGEIIVLSGGSPSFARLQARSRLQKEAEIARASRQNPVAYVIFDLLYIGGENIMSRPLGHRRDLLSGTFAGADFAVLSDGVREQGVAFSQAVFARDLEGVMAKDLNSPYLPGHRTRSWLKIKSFKTREAIILGYLPSPFGSGFRSLALGEALSGHSYRFMGLVGSGLSEAETEKLHLLLKPSPAGERPPLTAPHLPPETRNLIWVCPIHRCLVQYLEETEEGYLRHPVYLGLIREKEDPHA